MPLRRTRVNTEAEAWALTNPRGCCGATSAAPPEDAEAPAAGSSSPSTSRTVMRRARLIAEPHSALTERGAENGPSLHILFFGNLLKPDTQGPPRGRRCKK